MGLNGRGTRQATTVTERLARSPVLTNREQPQMVMSKGARWYTGQATIGGKRQAEHPVLTDRETTPTATLYRAKLTVSEG